MDAIIPFKITTLKSIFRMPTRQQIKKHSKKESALPSQFSFRMSREFSRVKRRLKYWLSGIIISQQTISFSIGQASMISLGLSS